MNTIEKTKRDELGLFGINELPEKKKHCTVQTTIIADDQLCQRKDIKIESNQKSNQKFIKFCDALSALHKIETNVQLQQQINMIQ